MHSYNQQDTCRYKILLAFIMYLTQWKIIIALNYSKQIWADILGESSTVFLPKWCVVVVVVLHNIYTFLAWHNYASLLWSTWLLVCWGLIWSSSRLSKTVFGPLYGLIFILCYYMLCLPSLGTYIYCTLVQPFLSSYFANKTRKQNVIRCKFQ